MMHSLDEIELGKDLQEQKQAEPSRNYYVMHSDKDLAVGDRELTAGMHSNSARVFCWHDETQGEGHAGMIFQDNEGGFHRASLYGDVKDSTFCRELMKHIRAACCSVDKIMYESYHCDTSYWEHAELLDEGNISNHKANPQLYLSDLNNGYIGYHYFYQHRGEDGQDLNKRGLIALHECVEKLGRGNIPNNLESAQGLFTQESYETQNSPVHFKTILKKVILPDILPESKSLGELDLIKHRQLPHGAHPDFVFEIQNIEPHHMKKMELYLEKFEARGRYRLFGDLCTFNWCGTHCFRPEGFHTMSCFSNYDGWHETSSLQKMGYAKESFWQDCCCTTYRHNCSSLTFTLLELGGLGEQLKKPYRTHCPSCLDTPYVTMRTFYRYPERRPCAVGLCGVLCFVVLPFALVIGWSAILPPRDPVVESLLDGAYTVLAVSTVLLIISCCICIKRCHRGQEGTVTPEWLTQMLLRAATNSSIPDIQLLHSKASFNDVVVVTDDTVHEDVNHALINLKAHASFNQRHHSPPPTAASDQAPAPLTVQSVHALTTRKGGLFQRPPQLPQSPTPACMPSTPYACQLG